MTHPDPTAAARALAAVLEQENAALAALDLAAATALLAAKEAALAAFVAGRRCPGVRAPTGGPRAAAAAGAGAGRGEPQAARPRDRGTKPRDRLGRARGRAAPRPRAAARIGRRAGACPSPPASVHAAGARLTRPATLAFGGPGPYRAAHGTGRAPRAPRPGRRREIHVRAGRSRAPHADRLRQGGRRAAPGARPQGRS